jgi:hypothetical protein
MTAQQEINEVCENASEWMEMTDDPALLAAVILANKVVELKEHIDFLQKRLKYEISKQN